MGTHLIILPIKLSRLEQKKEGKGRLNPSN
jgi:hypothetical protein